MSLYLIDTMTLIGWTLSRR